MAWRSMDQHDTAGRSMEHLFLYLFLVFHFLNYYIFSDKMGLAWVWSVKGVFLVTISSSPLHQNTAGCRRGKANEKFGLLGGTKRGSRFSEKERFRERLTMCKTTARASAFRWSLVDSLSVDNFLCRKFTDSPTQYDYYGSRFLKLVLLPCQHVLICVNLGIVPPFPIMLVAGHLTCLKMPMLCSFRNLNLNFSTSLVHLRDQSTHGAPHLIVR